MKSFTILSFLSALVLACTFATAAPIEPGVARVIAQNRNMACFHHCGVDRRPTHPSHIHTGNNNNDLLSPPPPSPNVAQSYARPGLFDGSDMPSFSALFEPLSQTLSMHGCEWLLHAVGLIAGVFVVYCVARFVRRRMGLARVGEYEVLVGKW